MKLSELDGNIDDYIWRKHARYQILMSKSPYIVKEVTAKTAIHKKHHY